MSIPPLRQAQAGFSHKIQAWRRWGTLCLLAALALHAEARTVLTMAARFAVEM